MSKTKQFAYIYSRFKSVMGVKKGTNGAASEVPKGASYDFLRNPKIGKFGEMVLKKTDPHYKTGIRGSFKLLDIRLTRCQANHNMLLLDQNPTQQPRNQSQKHQHLETSLHLPEHHPLQWRL